jgi:hypothetical protein
MMWKGGWSLYEKTHLEKIASAFQNVRDTGNNVLWPFHASTLMSLVCPLCQLFWFPCHDAVGRVVALWEDPLDVMPSHRDIQVLVIPIKAKEASLLVIGHDWQGQPLLSLFRNSRGPTRARCADIPRSFWFKLVHPYSMYMPFDKRPISLLFLSLFIYTLSCRLRLMINDSLLIRLSTLFVNDSLKPLRLMILVDMPRLEYAFWLMTGRVFLAACI